MKLPLDVQCRARGLPAPVPEFPFAEAEGRKFCFDWCFVEARLGVEMEGGLYGRGKPCPVCNRKAPGAHSSIDRMLRDIEKYNLACLLGWRGPLRFTVQQVESGEAVTVIARALGLEA